MTAVRWVLFLAVTVFAGCASDEKTETETHLDRLWESGHGFNNPNAQRRRDGLPPVDFSGKVID